MMSDNPLGQPTRYLNKYSPHLLFAIARLDKRKELFSNLPDITGEDIWNAFEISWLNLKGVPQIAIGEFRFNAKSPNIIESKSLKLYLNSFNQSQFADYATVEQTIQDDLSVACGDTAKVKLYSPQQFSLLKFGTLNGEVIDELDISLDQYQYTPSLLEHSTSGDIIEETLVSHLLKSNCLITSQPDWATLQIRYRGASINRSKLLAYVVSFRSHNEFHEQCVERIFSDIKHFCKPLQLSVYARYTRRGGLDINPWRSDFETTRENVRLARQ